MGEEALGGYSNYFVGKHEDEWFTGVPHFGRVRFADVYPGIDLVYYSTPRRGGMWSMTLLWRRGRILR